MSPVKIMTLVGAFAVVAGLGLVVFQVGGNPLDLSEKGLTASTDGFSIRTRYPGILIAGIGAILLIAGSIMGRRSN